MVSIIKKMTNDLKWIHIIILSIFIYFIKFEWHIEVQVHKSMSIIEVTMTKIPISEL